MFTGLIETTANISALRRADRSVIISLIPARSPFAVEPGASVAVDGVCLTIEEVHRDVLTFRAVAETLSRTTLASCQVGGTVNLERSLRVDGRIDGHFVLGHSDGMGTLCGDRRVGDSLLRSIALPPALMPFMAAKGSVAVDGISLTISDRGSDRITVSLIPYSLTHTTLTTKGPGDHVNVECDILARYLHTLLIGKEGESGRCGTDGELYRKLERLGF